MIASSHRLTHTSLTSTKTSHITVVVNTSAPSRHDIDGLCLIEKHSVRCGMRSTKADFIFSKQVGAGTYGVVWQAVRKLDGMTYAVKELDLRYLQKRVNAFFKLLLN